MLLETSAIDIDPHQPRTELGDITDLAQSLREVGLVNPILVTTSSVTGRYDLLCGARRLAAAQHLEWPHIEATLRETPTSLAERLAIQRAENEGRQDLTLWEAATALDTQLRYLDVTPTNYAAQRGLDAARITRLAQLAHAGEPTRTALQENILRCPRAAAIFGHLSSDAQIQLLSAARRSGRHITREIAEDARRRAQQPEPFPDVVRLVFSADDWTALKTNLHLPADARPADVRAALLRGLL